MIENTNNLSIKQAIPTTEVNNFCEHWEMAIIIRGNATVTVGQKVYKIGSNAAVFFAPNEFHNLTAEENCEYILLQFTGAGELLDLLNNRVVCFEDEISLIERAVCLISDNQTPLNLKQGFTMLELFLQLCCEKEELQDCTPKNAKLFTLAAEIMRRNINSNLSINDLAIKLDVSVSNLKRIFINVAGVGVHEYYMFLKIAKAKQYLNGGSSVTETADLTGFANQAHFSAAFKRVTGNSPKEYITQKDKKPNHYTKNKSIKKSSKELPSYLL